MYKVQNGFLIPQSALFLKMSKHHSMVEDLEVKWWTNSVLPNTYDKDIHTE